MVLAPSMCGDVVVRLEPFGAFDAVVLAEAGEVGGGDEGFVGGEVFGVFEVLGDLVEVSGVGC